MRKRLPKSREEQRSYMSRNSVPEYRYINYDLELVKNEYDAAVFNFAFCNTKITLLSIKILEKASIFIKKQMLVCQMHHLAKPVFIRF